MKKINLIVISGSHNFGGDSKKIRSFEVSDFSPSSPEFLERVKSLASTFAFEFFDIDFDESEKSFGKAQTLEELQSILKKDLYEEDEDGWKQTNSISIIEIKNESILEGLSHLSENFFACEYSVLGKVERLKKDEKFKESLELIMSFNKLKELVGSNPESVSQTELERFEKMMGKIPMNIWPESLKKEYQEILEKHSS